MKLENAWPVFDLSAANIGFEKDEDLQAELDKSRGKYFDAPGNIDLVVTSAAFHPNKVTGSIYCKGDESWVNVKVTFSGPDGRSIDHWLQVPTTSITFGPKKILGLFKKYQQFLFGIGETTTVATLSKVTNKYFQDPAKLVGQKVNVDLGYENDHVAPVGSGFGVIVKGKPLQEDGADVVLPDRSSAIQHAKAIGIEPGFLRVLKFTPKKSAKTTKASDW